MPKEKKHEGRNKPLDLDHVAVGDGVSMSVGSDRYAGTVTFVSATGKTLRFTLDEAKQTGNYFGQQEWEHTSVPEDDTTDNAMHALWKNGRYVIVGTNGRRLGRGRHSYCDPHF